MIGRLSSREDGTALVLALAFLSLFGVFVGTLLSFADTGLRSSAGIAAADVEGTAAAAAADVAIDRLRGELALGREGDDLTCATPPALNGVTATVRCIGQTGSGLSLGDGGPAPDHTVLTMATGSEPGIRQVGGNLVSLAGDVFANGDIDAVALDVTGGVDALGTCSGVTTGNPPLRCSNTGGGADPADGTDPGYDPGISVPPADRAVPACGGGWLVSFAPGTYDDPDDLTALTDGGCAGKVFHFQPGTYYFDFDAPGSGSTWVIDDAAARVIGGTPLGWSTSASTMPALSVPGSCDLTAGGVLFIFGDESVLDVRAGGLELCPSPSSTEQRFSIFGLASGTGGPPTNVIRTAGSISSTWFAPTANALTIDGSSASATIPSTNPGTTVTLTASGYGGIPAGATLTGATLHVAHREGSVGFVSGITATVTPSGSPPVAVSVSKSNSQTTQVIDLIAAGLATTPAPTGFTVAYAVTGSRNKTSTVYLDGMRLELTYEMPSLDALDGCTTNTPYGNPGQPKCALFKVTGSQTDVAVHGTVYAPTAAIDLSPTAPSTVALKRGVIARTLWLEAKGAPQPSAVVSIPAAGGPWTDREVVLETSVGAVVRLEVRLTIEDDGGASPGQSVTVTRWEVDP